MRLSPLAFSDCAQSASVLAAVKGRPPLRGGGLPATFDGGEHAGHRKTQVGAEGWPSRSNKGMPENTTPTE